MVTCQSKSSHTKWFLIRCFIHKLWQLERACGLLTGWGTRDLFASLQSKSCHRCCVFSYQEGDFEQGQISITFIGCLFLLFLIGRLSFCNPTIACDIIFTNFDASYRRRDLFGRSSVLAFVSDDDR